jgi:hypothetical protein
MEAAKTLTTQGTKTTFQRRERAKRESDSQNRVITPTKHDNNM